VVGWALGIEAPCLECRTSIGGLLGRRYFGMVAAWVACVGEVGGVGGVAGVGEVVGVVDEVVGVGIPGESCKGLVAGRCRGLQHPRG